MSAPALAETTMQIGLVEDDMECRLALEQAIGQAPDMQLIWSAGTRAQALAWMARVELSASLDVLLVDLGLPDGSGLDVIAACRTRCPLAVAMVSTIFGDEEHVIRAIEAGAMGYLLKDLSAPEVLDELRRLHQGGSPINPMVARKLLLRQSTASAAPRTRQTGRTGHELAPQAAPGAESAVHLSARETEVLRLVAKGHTIHEAARLLELSSHTVHTHVRRMYAKLQVSSRMQAINKAISQGLLGEDLRSE